MHIKGLFKWITPHKSDLTSVSEHRVSFLQTSADKPSCTRLVSRTEYVSTFSTLRQRTTRQHLQPRPVLKMFPMTNADSSCIFYLCRHSSRTCNHRYPSLFLVRLLLSLRCDRLPAPSPHEGFLLLLPERLESVGGVILIQIPQWCWIQYRVWRINKMSQTSPAAVGTQTVEQEVSQIFHLNVAQLPPKTNYERLMHISIQTCCMKHKWSQFSCRCRQTIAEDEDTTGVARSCERNKPKKAQKSRLGSTNKKKKANSWKLNLIRETDRFIPGTVNSINLLILIWKITKFVWKRGFMKEVHVPPFIWASW